MMNRWKKLWAAAVCLTAWVLMAGMLTGCSVKKDDGNKVRDLEFSVAAETEIPEELRQIISEKQAAAFKLTYTDEKNLYIVTGYGQQESGGYSIAVNELYLAENSIMLDTELIGPGKGDQPGTEPSYPFIVIRTELLDLPVVFH